MGATVIRATDLEAQLYGNRLTTAEVLYYIPDHPSLLQSFMWQTLDVAPDFPRIQRFLEFWRREIDAVIHSVAIAGGLAACVTETPYQPAPPGHASGGFGYRDSKIDSAHWRVAFSGNSFTSRETVEKYLLYRAAELTLEQGGDWFQTADRHTDAKTSYYADPDPFYRSPFWSSYGWGWRPSWRYYGGFGGGFGWRSWDPWFGDPFWADRVDIQQVQSFEASAEIVVGKGPAPSGERVFDAHEVVKNLGPSVVKPKA